MNKPLNLSGVEWQNWADMLLQKHYGPGDYQKVPDKVQGDAGIEGYSISSGCAYQVYGPEEPLSTDERYEKYRNKITRDINKFINKHSLLEQIFGNIRIRRWILLVPSFDDKRIIEHATKKTKEVFAAKLPYVAQDFRVLIQDKKAFSVEEEQLINAKLSKLRISTNEIEKHDIDKWVDKNDNLVTWPLAASSRCTFITCWMRSCR